MGRPIAHTNVREGCFLTDGTRLYEVLRTWLPNGQVLLEDCALPWLPAEIRSVEELVAGGMQVVRPAPD